MSKYISLLRGINVTGKNMIKMAEMVKLYESMGFKNIKTYLQSGNVIFDTSSNDAQKMIKKIEKGIETNFGFQVKVIILSPDELKQVIKKNPFLKRKGIDKNHLYVSFLSEAPDSELLKNLSINKNPSEEFQIIEKAVYLCLPEGYGRTKLQAGIFEKKLNVTATARNWKTVNALNDLTC
jgi:uncharacterized protein (DUF1697 family)